MPPERLILLCGEFNKNLKQIEKALKIKILQNGTEFDLSGKEMMFRLESQPFLI